MAIWTFARLSLREATRSKFVPVTLILSAAYIGLIAWGSRLLLDHSSPVVAAQASAFGMEVFAFYMVSFTVALLAVFVTGSSVHHESETGLLQAMLTRPVSRWSMLAGKALGASLLVAIYVALLTGGIVLAVGLTVGYYPSRPVEAGALLFLQGLVILSLRLMLGIVLGNMASGILPLMIYGLGWMGGVVEFIGGAMSIESMVTAGVITSLVIPTDAIWRGVSYFLTPESLPGIMGRTLARSNPFISLQPIATPMLAWSCVYVAGVFLAAIAFFARRDI